MARQIQPPGGSRLSERQLPFDQARFDIGVEARFEKVQQIACRFRGLWLDHAAIYVSLLRAGRCAGLLVDLGLIADDDILTAGNGHVILTGPRALRV